MRSFRHPVEPHREPPAPAPATDLHVCLGCGRPFVVPDEILSLLSGNRYLTRLRCTNCDRLRIGVFSEDAMAALDIELTRAQELIHRDAILLERALFEEEIQRFADQLRLGLLLPEDF